MKLGRGTRGRYRIAAVAAILVLVVASASALPRTRQLAARRHLVAMTGIAYQPGELEVSRGDTIVWINRDLVPHTATADGKSGWSSATLVPGDSGRFIPSHRGEWRYHCQFHPTMRGKLIVR